jgi:AraC-like DNA-binding protein
MASFPPSSIPSEVHWRCADADRVEARANPGAVVVTRWTHAGDAPLEVANPGNDELHCIALNLKWANFTFSHAGRRVAQGRMTPGIAQVTAPGISTRTVFNSSADLAHLFVSQQVLAECYQDIFEGASAGAIVLDSPHMIRDPVLESLSQALIAARSNGALFGKMFVEQVSLAVVSRIVARHYARVAVQREAAPLQPWRLNRAMDFIEDHLSEQVKLEDIAASVGLSRMHFASQFRRATGVRPHEYLLKRRIDRAQQLLRSSQQRVLDVALECGFQSHAHFATVFKKIVGETPASWRAMVDHPVAAVSPTRCSEEAATS